MTIPHLCHCGAWGAFGYTKTTVDHATWFCADHRPQWTANAPTLPADRPTPARFATRCAFCDGEVDARTMGVYRWTSGWVQQRAGGGGNAITMPRRENFWAHKICVDRAMTPGAHERTLFDPQPTSPKNS